MIFVYNGNITFFKPLTSRRQEYFAVAWSVWSRDVEIALTNNERSEPVLWDSTHSYCVTKRYWWLCSANKKENPTNWLCQIAERSGQTPRVTPTLLTDNFSDHITIISHDLVQLQDYIIIFITSASFRAIRRKLMDFFGLNSRY